MLPASRGKSLIRPTVHHSSMRTFRTETESAARLQIEASQAGSSHASDPSPLRLVILMSASSPWSREVVRHLSALGVAVHVIEFQPKGRPRGYIDYARGDRTAEPDGLDRDAASIHRVRTPGSLPRRFASSVRSLRLIARECDADLILTLYGGSLAATAFLSRFRPYIVYVVGSDVLLATTLQKLVARITLTCSAAVLANGRHLARRVTGLAPRANVAPLYLGVDLADYSPTREKPQRLSFVCTRGFLDVYDNATIVRALSLLRDVPADLTISFLSSGPLLAETERLADNLISPFWRDRVIFRGGTPHDQLRNIVKAGSFYLSASLSDGTSSSLLEAMASGLIPIVTDIPANREWIIHEKNGLLFSTGDHNGLAERIRRAIRHEPWMENARLANRKLVEERADANVSMRKLLAILRTHCKRTEHSTGKPTPLSQCLL